MRRKAGLDLKKFRAYHRRSLSKEKIPKHACEIYYSDAVNVCVLCAKLLQLCLTLCNSMDCSLPCPSVHEILHAKVLEWVAMPSSRGSSQSRDQTSNSMSPELAGGFLTTNGTWETIRILENTEEGHLPVWGGAGGCQRGEAYSVLRDDPELHKLVRMKGHCRDQDRYEQRKSRIVCTGKNSKQLAFF